MARILTTGEDHHCLNRVPMHKSTPLLLAALLSMPALSRAPTPQDVSKIYGRIQYVDAFPDYTVEVVDAFPDLRVQEVDAFPDAAGKWEIVSAFPDFTIQKVDAFADFKIEYVDVFPGR